MTKREKHLLMILPGMALLLLAAHSLRLGDIGMVAALIVLIGLMLFRRGWVRIVLMAALAWGAFVWAETTLNLVGFRQAMGAPWMRLLAIMVGVVVIDLLALLAVAAEPGRRFFHQGDNALARAAVFLLSVVALAMIRSKVPFPILLADRYFPAWGWLEIMALGIYAQWIAGLMLAPGGHGFVRPRIWALFSAVFFGQLALGLAGMESMLMTGSLHLPVPALIAAGPVFRGEGLFMPILFGVTVLLVGPAWCSHLCYIGAWDDAMSRRGPRPGPSASVRRLSVFGRGAALILVVATALALRAMGVPGATAVLMAAGFGLIGVGVMVLVSSRMGLMAHCTAYCPMGIVSNVLGRLSPWRMRIDRDCCACGACFSRCRYGALDTERVVSGAPSLSCTLCGDCVSSCPHGQIGYRFPGLSPDAARTVFIVLIVSLHAVFLGVARI
ncbi:4Fe-4S binding protein [Pseudodesulfovibrio sp. F-1]|uniref:4Fe-4S binding protein n=1 Tax=Pseudodesulfovibrio alkaliphilus TaxID=2661613 RepID=A0A7K1KQP4_9BACT|nr:4Fe-4S binding protein [Pseudodesulfovibrio alkaliphilus]MUM78419.1 4Fe-4S binding protein [Pseudodesulfovibrio alkaliphilus]